MARYTQSFNRFKITTSQVLITLDDITKAKHVENIKEVLLSLLKLSVVPIINENDSVGTEEIKFGDNDGLAALVTNLLKADLLVLSLILMVYMTLTSNAWCKSNSSGQ